MPAKLHATNKESIYSMKRSSQSVLRLRLHIVLKNELHPNRLINTTRSSYYWRSCRIRLASLYKSRFQNALPLCPVFFEKRLPTEDLCMSSIRDWNRKLATLNC